MPIDSTHRGGCTGKLAYDDRPTAKRAAENFRKREGRRLHVYRCAWADHWHLTHSAEPRDQAAERNRSWHPDQG